MDLALEEKLTKAKVGLPVSGRTWKAPTKRASLENKNVLLKRSTWEKKMKEREDRKSLQLKEQEMKDETKRKRTEEHQRTTEKKRRKEENEKKSSVYQVITNTQKIKKMRKKDQKLLKKMAV